MNSAKIRSALAQAFESGGLGVPVSYPNDGYTPQANTPWAQFIIIPNQARSATLGTNGQDEQTGILQINLNYPLNTGDGAALQKADQICSAYKPGTSSTYQGLQVKFRASSTNGTPQTVNGYFQTIITIEWSARYTR